MLSLIIIFFCYLSTQSSVPLLSLVFTTKAVFEAQRCKDFLHSTLSHSVRSWVLHLHQYLRLQPINKLCRTMIIHLLLVNCRNVFRPQLCKGLPSSRLWNVMCIWFPLLLSVPPQKATLWAAYTDTVQTTCDCPEVKGTVCEINSSLWKKCSWSGLQLRERKRQDAFQSRDCNPTQGSSHGVWQQVLQDGGSPPEATDAISTWSHRITRSPRGPPPSGLGNGFPANIWLPAMKLSFLRTAM